MYRPLVIYGSACAILVVSLLFLASYILSSISEINIQKGELTSETAVLSERLSVLEGLPPNAQEHSQMVLAALPSQNNSLVTVAQLRRVASENGVIIKNLDLSADSGSGGKLPSVLVNFDFEGEAKNTIAFISAVTNLAPLIVIDNISLQTTQDGRAVSAIMAVRTQWATLPEKLPALTESIAALSTEEQELLDRLSKLTLPSFGQSVISTGTESAQVGKADPFTAAQ